MKNHLRRITYTPEAFLRKRQMAHTFGKWGLLVIENRTRISFDCSIFEHALRNSRQRTEMIRQEPYLCSNFDHDLALR